MLASWFSVCSAVDVFVWTRCGKNCKSSGPKRDRCLVLIILIVITKLTKKSKYLQAADDKSIKIIVQKEKKKVPQPQLRAPPRLVDRTISAEKKYNKNTGGREYGWKKTKKSAWKKGEDKKAIKVCARCRVWIEDWLHSPEHRRYLLLLRRRSARMQICQPVVGHLRIAEPPLGFSYLYARILRE